MGSFWGVFWLVVLGLAFTFAYLGARRRQGQRQDDPGEFYRRTGRVHGVKNLGSAPPATHHRMGRN